MAVYQIGYTDDGSTSRTIDLLPGDGGVRVDWRTEINRNVTSTGIYENVVQNTLRFVSFEVYFQEEVFHQLETFMSFAQQGQPFSFTKDSTKGSEVLAFATAAGEEDLFVSDGTVDGFEAGDYVVLSHPEGVYWDVLKIDSVAFDEMNVTPTLQHSYPEDSPLTWYYYFPALYLLDEDFDPRREGAFWNHTFECVEVR